MPPENSGRGASRRTAEDKKQDHIKAIKEMVAQDIGPVIEESIQKSFVKLQVTWLKSGTWALWMLVSTSPMSVQASLRPASPARNLTSTPRRWRATTNISRPQRWVRTLKKLREGSQSEEHRRPVESLRLQARMHSPVRSWGRDHAILKMWGRRGGQKCLRSSLMNTEPRRIPAA